MIVLKKGNKFYLFINNNSLIDPFIFFSILKKNTFNRICSSIYIFIILFLNLFIKNFVRYFPLIKIYNFEELPKYLKTFLNHNYDINNLNNNFYIRNAGAVYKNRVLVYHLLNKKLKSISKVDENESYLLTNENYILDYLGKTNFLEFIPKIKSFKKNNIYTELTTFFIGKRFKQKKKFSFRDYPLELIEIIKHSNFYKINLSYDNIYYLDWINYSKKYFNNEFNELKDLVKNDIYLCFIHGDLISENIFFYNKKNLLLDFENSSLYGPYLTDYIGFWISLNFKHLQRKPQQYFINFKDFFASFDKEQIFTALFYLSYITGSSEALEIYLLYKSFFK